MDIPSDRLRDFLLNTFSEEELEEFCFDYFQEVFYDFGQGMSRRRKVQVLLAYAQLHQQVGKLLIDLSKARPREFAARFERLPQPPPAPISATTRLTGRVFLSHAYEDAPLARRLADALRAAGRSVWMTPDSVLPGETRGEAITRGVTISGIFLVLVTPAAVASDWVQYEMVLAINQARRLRMDIVPLAVEPAEPPATWLAYPALPFGDYAADLRGVLERLAARGRRPPSHALQPPLPMPTTPRPPTRSQTIPRPPAAPPSPSPRPTFRIHAPTDVTFIHIPAGPFLYGAQRQPRALPDYWIGRYPVTNAQYRRFLMDNPDHPVPYEPADWARAVNWNPETRDFPPGHGDVPVALVRWSDACAYCAWAGLRLPTEEEWEKAARGTDGRHFPWGDEPPTPERANFGRAHGGPTPVGRFSPAGDSPFGAGDMAGNVAEWTATAGDEASGTAAEARIMRGGAWSFEAGHLAADFRLEAFAERPATYMGFRVAADDPGAARKAVPRAPESRTPEYRIHAQSRVEFALVPAGPFFFGDERQRLTLPVFWIGRYEVTNAQFERFVRATGYVTTAERKGYARDWRDGVWQRLPGATWRQPHGPGSTIAHKAAHPVVQVSAMDAEAFCRWAGLRLPTEQEWEKAARGSEGRAFPWGNDGPTTERLNFGRHAGAAGDTTPVGHFSPAGDSPHGCADMAGNVWEWTTTPYDKGPHLQVLKGGSWADPETSWLRGAAAPRHATSAIGFRVAVSELG